MSDDRGSIPLAAPVRLFLGRTWDRWPPALLAVGGPLMRNETQPITSMLSPTTYAVALVRMETGGTPARVLRGEFEDEVE